MSSHSSCKNITVWSDIGCPWATLALHTLHEAARRQSVAIMIDHRAFPLELFNRRSTPKDILDAEIVAIAGLIPDLGWRAWTGDLWTYPVTTLPALEAVQVAKHPDIGGFRGSDQLDTALRRAFYIESRCISIHAVIIEIAKKCSLVDGDRLAYAMAHGQGRAAVYTDWQNAGRERVVGSPHLCVGQTMLHNPGASYMWTAPPGRGFPRFDSYSVSWADQIVSSLLDKE